MKIGVVYPQIEMSGSTSNLRQVAREAEATGFSHLLMYDHVLGVEHADRDPPFGVPYDESDPFHDPLVAFGYLAGITEKLEFFTGILVLPQRPTALVARQAADVALFSDNRLSLGVGVGWNAVEYSALGQSFATRGKRLDEQISLLRQLWEGQVVNWQGAFDVIDRAAICPAPERSIPIYCGGFVRAAFVRAARLADGFIFGGQRIGGLVEQWRQLQQLLDENGRSSANFGAHALIINERFSALTVQEAADAIRVWQDAGGTHASIVSMGQGFTDSEQHLEYFADVFVKAR